MLVIAYYLHWLICGWMDSFFMFLPWYYDDPTATPMYSLEWETGRRLWAVNKEGCGPERSWHISIYLHCIAFVWSSEKEKTKKETKTTRPTSFQSQNGSSDNCDAVSSPEVERSSHLARCSVFVDIHWQAGHSFLPPHDLTHHHLAAAYMRTSHLTYSYTRAYMQFCLWNKPAPILSASEKFCNGRSSLNSFGATETEIFRNTGQW